MVAIEWPEITDDPWLGAGTERVLLPSGTAVVWEPTTVQQLMVRDALPGYLRSMAIQFVGEGVDYQTLDDDGQRKWRELVGMFIVNGVRAVALPGATSFTRTKLTPEQVDDADPIMPRPDLETLQHLAMHLRTVEQVNATSRLVQMEREMREMIARVDADPSELDAFRAKHARETDEIQRSIAREASGGLAGWQTFRRDSGGADPGADGGAVRTATVSPADHLGPGGRPRDRRRTGDPSRPRSRRTRDTSSS